jgi:cytochrome b561
MSYREKFAWLTLVAIVVSFGAYFAVAYSGSIEGLPNFRLLIVYAGAMLLQLVILGVGRLIIGASSGDEARARPDERDRAIAHRAGHRAYYVMMTGLVFTGVYLPFTEAGWHIVHAALLTYVVSEIVRGAVVVRAYRRGWHG